MAVSWLVAKALGRVGAVCDRFGSRCRGHTRKKHELCVVSAARKEPAGPALSPHLTARHPRLGRVPVSSGHRWPGWGVAGKKRGRQEVASATACPSLAHTPLPSQKGGWDCCFSAEELLGYESE